MFRGFRWQLPLCLIAGALFAGGLWFRLDRESADSATPTPQTATRQSTPIAPSTASPIATQVTSASSATPIGRFREGLVGEARRINPLFAHLNPVDRDISSLIFESLFVINDYGEAVPHLARELVISSDGLAYVIRLRDDILWQDGLELTAADVAFTVALMSEVDSPQAAFWRAVEVQPLGDFLLRFRLAQPLSGFPHLLTFGVLPEHALRGGSAADMAAHPFNLSPIGSGAYQLAHLEVSAGGQIERVQMALSPVFQRRPEAASGYHFKTLEFLLYPNSDAAMAGFAANEVDALANVGTREQLLALPNADMYTQVESAVAMLIFNWQDTPFEERRVRHALSLALDAPQIVAMTLGADAAHADSPYPPGYSAYLPNPAWTQHDLAEAQRLFAASRVADEDTERQFTLLVHDSAGHAELARGTVAAWTLLDMDFAVDAVDSRRFQERLAAGEFDAAIVLQRIGGNPDMFRYWHSAQHGIGGNYGAVSEHAIDELLELARGEIYAVRRAEHARAFAAEFAEQTIAIPLTYPLYTYAVRSGMAGIGLGYLATPADRFRGIQRWRPAALRS